MLVIDVGILLSIICFAKWIVHNYRKKNYMVKTKKLLKQAVKLKIIYLILAWSMNILPVITLSFNVFNHVLPRSSFVIC